MGDNMRVLWLSPGLRILARSYVEGLRQRGIDTMLVTSNLHPDSGPQKPYETVLLGRPIPTSGWIPVYRTLREIKRFQPDVIVTEFLRDPRWRLFSDLAPRVRLVHDAAPHDETHIPPWWNRVSFEKWDEKADATIVFSKHVANSLLARGVPESRLFVAPLVSDLAPELKPSFVPPRERSNVVLVGRQRPYKNHKVVFEAWDAHTKGEHWPGDELVLIGDGDVDCAVPSHVRWQKSAYKYSEVALTIARARASIVHSRNASQSGVQVLSLQLGVPTIISTRGGLPEYQPQELPPVDVDDIDGLVAAFDRLADSDELELQCLAAEAHYRSHFDIEVAARRMEDILSEVCFSTR